ncbi:AraC family transcriptional regulator [Clostridium sp. E02]|uniref:AraC family transcriptional regulator n=1 Tax=Clostridium sp. E02 TaxID=2487134 RepID=UPI000F529E70|nr:AraC family transcriptional regulator [Clostridium sp. E02]
MSKQREKVEFRYYEIPNGEPVLALFGEGWIREYGRHVKYLHFHNLMEIGYCHFGTGEVVLGQERIPFSPKSIMIVPPRLPHTTNSEEGTQGYWEWLYVDMEQVLCNWFVKDPLSKKNILKQIQRTGYLLSGDEHPSLFRVIIGIIEEARMKKPYYKDNIRGLLQAWLTELLRLSDAEVNVMRRRPHTALISDALNYISEQYLKEIKIKDLAVQCNMSESHFRRVFEDGMKMKPLEYINLIRIQQSCEFLKNTEKSMDEVAESSGFASVSAFNRNFKKVMSCSPYQWKKSKEKDENRLDHCQISTHKGWQ